MQFFLDTSNLDEISELKTLGLVDGITTNPSIIAKSGKNIFEILKAICDLVDGPVSAEVVAVTTSEMLDEAERLLKIAKNITIKVPLTFDGLKTCKILTDNGHKVNVTLCFSSAQAVLAAKAGATYVSPFIGRLDDIGFDGLQLIADIVEIYSNYPDVTTKVLAASIRHPIHAIESLRHGAHVLTCPPSVLRQMVNHPLTKNGLDAFLEDWKKVGQKI